MPPPRRLPAPWSVIEHAESFEVKAASGQSLAFVYFREDLVVSPTGGRLTKDEARRVAANIAKLPGLLTKP
jgi:hypothetical protein